jgi:hypothetical protein
MNTNVKKNLEIAVREYEAHHAKWMNTSVFSADYKRVKSDLDKARTKYLAAYKAANPGHIIM